MLDVIAQINRYLWACIELVFAILLAVMLVYLILGDASGSFVLAVAANVIAFVNVIPAQSLIALAIVAALVLLLMRNRRLFSQSDDR